MNFSRSHAKHPDGPLCRTGQDVYRFLAEQGCEYEGDRYPTGTGWFALDGMPFTMPSPVDGCFDADIVNRILSDRWIPRGTSELQRIQD